MNMRICHTSDLHGRFCNLPWADLYIVTGDMLQNFPLYVFESGFERRREIWDPLGDTPRPDSYYVDRILDPKREKEKQDLWIESQSMQGRCDSENTGEASLRRYLGNPDAPIVCVRGNHDFTDLAPAFGGDVWEVNDDPTRFTTVLGLKIGGCRGINFICGEWSDEIDATEFERRMKLVPKDLNILITHAPPQCILDAAGEHYGSAAIRSYVNRHMYDNEGYGALKLHCFGHVHESFGSKHTENTKGLIFSNAATSYILYEISV